MKAGFKSISRIDRTSRYCIQNIESRRRSDYLNSTDMPSIYPFTKTVILVGVNLLPQGVRRITPTSPLGGLVFFGLPQPNQLHPSPPAWTAQFRAAFGVEANPTSGRGLSWIGIEAMGGFEKMVESLHEMAYGFDI